MPQSGFGFFTPGRFAGLYDDLPAEVGALAEVARGLMIHRAEGEIFAYTIPEERLHNDAETRYLDDILGIIVEREGASLTRPRELGDRFVGICRDFALLFCSFLRYRGIPTRLRSGFADYFGSGDFHFDHVVTEFWDDRHGWRLADPQLADPRVAEVDFAAARTMFDENGDLRTPGEVLCLAPFNGPSHVKLR